MAGDKNFLNGEPKVNFGGEQISGDEAKEKSSVFNKKALMLLEKIKEKDPTAHFNTDVLAGMQAIAFTSKGRIIVYNNYQAIVIEQEGKEDIKFSANEEEKALVEIQKIVDSI